MKPLQRYCLTLDLNEDPAKIKEYIHWHRSENIWPEIPAGIKAAGIRYMEIYLLGTRLFMIIEAGPEFDFERDMERLSALPRQTEWEEFVAKFQKTSPNSKSKEKWRLMDRIFSLNPAQ